MRGERLRAEQLGSASPFYSAPLGETRPLWRCGEGISSRAVLGDVLVLEAKAGGCCSAVTKRGGEASSQVLCGRRDPAPTALYSPPELSVCNIGGGAGLLALPRAVSASVTLGFLTWFS